MRSFSVRIIPNNEAGTWASLEAKIAAIKAFYAPVCDLNITLGPSKLTPQFAPYEPSSGGTSVYRVDEAWYEANVSPLAQGADIVMFVVPPSDHPNVVTLMGLDYYQEGKMGETTVFSDETSHVYVAGVDQGETFVNYACHELSHHFYGLLAKTDNTHPNFYGGTPEKVLADFDFNERQLEWYQLLIQKLEQEIGLLKSRQVPPIGDPAPPQSQNSASGSTQTPNPTPTSFPARITQWAAVIAKEEGANPTSHNPGNLKISSLTKSWGATQGHPASDGGYLCQFQTEDAGFTALCNFLVLGAENQLLAFHTPEARTLSGFTKIFAGNPPSGYTDAIVQAMGGDPNVQISTFLS
jgi:hypothetical protein